MAFSDDRQRFGLAAALAAEVLRRLERKLGLHIWAVELRGVDPGQSPETVQGGDYTFRRLSQAEAEALARVPGMGLSPEFVAEETARGAFCMAALQGDRVAGYVWRSARGAPVGPGLWLGLRREGLGCGYKAFVHPEHRGRGINIAVGRAADADIFAQGVKQLLTYVALHNLSSIRSLGRDQVRERAGYAGFLQLGARTVTFRSPAARRVLHFVRSAGAGRDCGPPLGPSAEGPVSD